MHHVLQLFLQAAKKFDVITVSVWSAQILVRADVFSYNNNNNNDNDNNNNSYYYYYYYWWHVSW